MKKKVTVKMTEAELLMLNAAYRNGDVKPVHYMVLALSAAGNSQYRIAKIVGPDAMGRQGINKLVLAYNRDGLAGIISRAKNIGRPPRLSLEKRKEFAEIYHKGVPPEGWGKSGKWTIRDLRDWMMVERGVSIPHPTVSRWVRQFKPKRLGQPVPLGWLPPVEE